MTTKTVITDDQINDAWSNNLTGMFMSGDSIKKFARDIEKSVLESDQVQGWKRDSERYHKINHQHLVSYDYKRLSWELERTAMGEAFYGNAIRVAKYITGLMNEDLDVLERYSTGTNQGTDHITLQEIALKISNTPTISHWLK